jgi:glutaredoxin 3
MLIVYSKTNCPFCDQAKKLLDKYEIEYESINVEQDPAKRAWLQSQGHRSVPQIYTEDDQLFVEGGFQGLAKLSKDEILKRLGELNA